MNPFEELLRLLTEVLELDDDHALVSALRRREDGDEPWSGLSDEDITAVLDAVAELAENDDVPTEAIVTLADLRDEIVVEQSSRQERAAEDERLREEARRRIAGQDGEEEGEGDPETPEGEEPEGGESEGEGEGDPEGDPETPETPEGEGEEQPAEGEPEPVTAATGPDLVDLARRRRARTRPAPDSAARELALVAAAGLPNVGEGHRFRTIEAFADELWSAFQAGISTDANGRARIASARVEYPEDRFLDGNTRENMRKITEVQRQLSQVDYRTEEGRVAAGGLCAPTEVRYDLIGISEETRALPQALMRFGADRGGVRFIEPPTISDLTDAITVWTEATDTNPGAETKDCLTVTCGAETEVVVDAIVKCVQFGNFSARTFREQTDRWWQLAGAAHARVAEDRLFDRMCDLSTAVSAGQILGAARDVLENLDQIGAAFRYRHRMNPRAPLDMFLPFYVMDMMRADLVRQLPGDDTYAVTDAQINAWFAVRNVRPIWLWDAGSENDVFRAAQPAGVGINPWPSTVEVVVTHPGAFLHVDGGELNLGVVRDSTLNSTNDFQMFEETFENVAFVGIESLCVTLDLCPDGASSGTVDIDPCTTGS